MTSDTEPRTAAGRDLVSDFGYKLHPLDPAAMVRAIEDESWNAALAAVEEAVGTSRHIIETNVLAAAIASLRKPVTP